VLSPVEVRELLQEMEQSAFDFSTLSVRGKCQLELNGKTYDVAVQLRIQKDEVIWLSLQAPLIGEVARLLITTDSIQVLNRMDRTYYQKRLDEYPIYADGKPLFFEIQSLLTGTFSPSWVDVPDLQAKKLDNSYWLLDSTLEMQQQMHLGAGLFVQYFSHIQKNQNSHIESEYKWKKQAYQQKHRFPNSMQVNVDWTNATFKSRFDFQTARFNDPIEIPFSVPGSFELIQ